MTIFGETVSAAPKGSYSQAKGRKSDNTLESRLVGAEEAHLSGKRTETHFVYNTGASFLFFKRKEVCENGKENSTV